MYIAYNVYRYIRHRASPCLITFACPEYCAPLGFPTRQTVQSYTVFTTVWRLCDIVCLAKDVLCLPTFYLPSCLPSCLTSRLSLDDTACLPAGLCPLFPWHEQHERLKLIIDMKSTAVITSSTAQGGGGSFKNRKPIGRLGCCWLTDGRANPLMDRKVIGVVLFAIVAVVTSLTTPGMTSLTTPGCNVVWCSAVVVAVVVFVVVLMLLKL